MLRPRIDETREIRVWECPAELLARLVGPLIGHEDGDKV